MTTEERIIEVLTYQFGVTELNRNTRFREDLGADSIDQVEIVLELEDEFDIDIPDAESDSDKFQNVGQVIDAVVAKIASKSV